MINIPNKIKVTYKIITPMFIGDANQKATAISPQSFKGCLRFWWRALAWSAIRQKAQSDETALEQLHHQEALLFGSSAINKKLAKNEAGQDKDKKIEAEQDKDKKIYGKGAVSIKIIQPERLHTLKNWPNSSRDPSSYLSFGITESGKGDNFQPHRQAIKENVCFSVELILSNTLSDEQKSQLDNALKAIGLFSGLGGRSRRALGSIQIIQLNEEKISFESPQSFAMFSSQLLGNYKSSQAPYTAFSKDAAFDVSNNSYNSARDAHTALGRAFKNYRGSPNLEGAQKKVFGLPMKGADTRARRASPLFFHIFETKNKKYGFSVLYLPSSIFHKNEHHQKVDYELTKSFLTVMNEGVK